jgi:hypothetical protein
MARAVSRIPGATAIIVPYNVESRIATAGHSLTHQRRRPTGVRAANRQAPSRHTPVDLRPKSDPWVGLSVERNPQPSTENKTLGEILDRLDS